MQYHSPFPTADATNCKNEAECHNKHSEKKWCYLSGAISWERNRLWIHINKDLMRNLSYFATGYRCLSSFRLTGLYPSWLGMQNTQTASLQRSKTLSSDCPRYDIKQSDTKAPVMQELWGMRSTPSLLSLSGSLWKGTVYMFKNWFSIN